MRQLVKIFVDQQQVFSGHENHRRDRATAPILRHWSHVDASAKATAMNHCGSGHSSTM